MEHEPEGEMFGSSSPEAEEPPYAAAIARLREVRAEVNWYRGNFLSVLISIEELLDDYIEDYFLPDEYSIFIASVLSRIALDSKIQIVRELARDVGVYDEMKAFLKEVDALRQMRNVFAHATLEIRNSTDPDEMYRVTKRRLRPGDAPRPNDHIAQSMLQDYLDRAHDAFRQGIVLSQVISDAHTNPHERREVPTRSRDFNPE